MQLPTRRATNEIIMHPERHFILTHGRSGSNFLVNSINMHPDLTNYGEVLGEWTVPYKLYRIMSVFDVALDKYLDKLYSNAPLFYSAQVASAISHITKGKPVNFKRKSNLKSLGFKDFAFLLEKRQLLSYLENRQDIKIIHLVRKNHLKRYVSLLNMRNTGIVKSEENKKNNKITVNIKDTIENLEIFEKEIMTGNLIVEKLDSHRVLNIDYDKYFENSQSITDTNNMVFQFLGVTELDILSKQQKIMSNNLMECIENYHELYEALKGTRFENLLTD